MRTAISLVPATVPWSVSAQTAQDESLRRSFPNLELVSNVRPGVAQTTHIKTLEPPFELSDIHNRMYWHPRHTTDSGHRWLRERLRTIATALDKTG
jgi:hypothetical protein